MEEQIVQLLAATQSNVETPRKAAELQLNSMYPAPGFAVALTSVASHESVPLNIRQASLLYLRQFIQAAWSAEFEEFRGHVLVNDADKAHIRQTLLELALNNTERKLRKAASYVVSKIGSADFPEEWPELLPMTLQIIQTGTEDQMGGALKLLADLIEESFNEEQFFGVATELVNSVYTVAVNEGRKSTVRALAITVFRGCFDILEMLMEEHKQAVKAFADEALAKWLPFFLQIMQSKLPSPPTNEEEADKSPMSEAYRGLVAMKLQVVKALLRIRAVLPSNLAPHSPALFTATWEELASLQRPYQDLFIDDQRQSRLEDDDGLPYTLDFLVLEELDFMTACLKAAPVKKELETQLHASGVTETAWITQVMQLLVSFSQITSEEEALWNIDVNIYLSEETSVTANYTPRTACGDMATKLAEWLKDTSIEGLMTYSRSIYSTDSSWKLKEAALYVVNQLLVFYQEEEQNISSDAAQGFIELAKSAMQHSEEFLRARGCLVAGSLIRTAGNALTSNATQYLEATMQAVTSDDCDVVKAAAIRALQFYIEPPVQDFVVPMQEPIIRMLSTFISTQDLQDKVDSDDFMATLVQTIRDALLLDINVSLKAGGLDLLFTTASYGASLFIISSMVSETFEEVAERVAAGGSEQFAELSNKVLPMLIGAFRVGDPSQENALLNLAADLLAILTRLGSTPLPAGFIATVMPKMTQILLQSNDEELLKSCTCAVRNMLVHDHEQLFAWHDQTTQKSGLEVVLLIVDRLLGPGIDDNAGAEVGGLAAELVEKAGAEKLGPYLMQLLRAVAVRLGSATQAQFIQNLLLVFARLALHSASEVVEFLAQVQIGNDNGLNVIITKWLENSVNFAGYDEIRQNVIALSKLYDLNDHRLSQLQVKGDLIVPKSDKIMTRSRARIQPDQFTVVSANVKILKVLVEELLNAAGSRQRLEELALENAESEGSDDEDWEDDPNTLDLGLSSTRAELMAFAEETPGSNRRPDDETQNYLVQFFHSAAQKPQFQEHFNALTPEEQDKLRSFG